MSKAYFPDSTLDLDVLEAGQISRKVRAHGGRLMMVEVCFASGAVGAEHRHRHEQMAYCLSGEFSFNVDGETATLRAGDPAYVPASALHGTSCVAAGRLLGLFTPPREDFLESRMPELR